MKLITFLELAGFYGHNYNKARKPVMPTNPSWHLCASKKTVKLQNNDIHPIYYHHSVQCNQWTSNKSIAMANYQILLFDE